MDFQPIHDLWKQDAYSIGLAVLLLESPPSSYEGISDRMDSPRREATLLILEDIGARAVFLATYLTYRHPEVGRSHAEAFALARRAAGKVFHDVLGYADCEADRIP